MHILTFDFPMRHHDAQVICAIDLYVENSEESVN